MVLHRGTEGRSVMKAAFHTLGCKVNQYETESLKEQFKQLGYEIVPETSVADVYVVNTCTVTNLADRKSRQFIRRAHRVNPEAVIAVTGCYIQMNPEEASAIEGVDVVCGINEKHHLASMVEQYRSDRQKRIRIREYQELQEYEDTGIIYAMESRSRAFVKIQEGCDRFCSYCIIPYARGRVRSRDEEEIVREVAGLVERGYPEIVLTGINTALYGKERGNLGIVPLLAKLEELPGDFRIRLSSLEPTVIDAEYVKGLFGFSRLCHHLHLSIQSGSDTVLARMNRRYSRTDYLEIVSALREFDPCYGISTDIIVGFPGETEEEFQDSISMIHEADFCRVHGFRYSMRKGTKAAEMSGQISGTVKQARIEALQEAADEQELRFRERCRGKVRRVLFETYDPDTGLACGYADNYLRVYVPGEPELVQSFYDVKLLDSYMDGMRGELV